MKTMMRTIALALTVAVAAPLMAAEPGVLLDLAAPGAEKRLEPSSRQVTAARTNEGGAPRIAVSIAPGDDGYPGVTLAPQGKPAWDLSSFGRVEARLTNTGEKPITVTLRIDNPGDWQADPWNGDNPKDSGAQFSSDAVSAVTISVTGAATADRAPVVESVTAQTPPPPALAEWLGQRPPVPGEWTMTFRDEFDGSTIDASKWNIYTENYWDKRSHFSKANVVVEGGVARLRFERKTGHHNDDASRNVTDYATGFLDSYGKWTQRYGYFEARMKLPSAPGLWPAFWLMPDRGADKGPQWVRASTEDGGMEFDILEYLSRWGPYRYNIAMHWDGYGERHQSIGSQRIYVRPDADGFITAGLLWTPGSAVFYANGQEVARWHNPRVSRVPSYPIFTHVSGGWDNAPLQDEQLPDDFVIDYIRVWQRADLTER